MDIEVFQLTSNLVRALEQLARAKFVSSDMPFEDAFAAGEPDGFHAWKAAKKVLEKAETLLFQNPTGWGFPARYLTDDRDKPEEELHVLQIVTGGNGDYYVSVMPKGDGWAPAVRLCTSGGASRACPGLTVAISQAYRAMLAAGCQEQVED